MSLKGSNFYLVTYFRRKRTKTLSRVEILILTILSPITTTSTKISKIAETYENFGSLSFFNMFFLDLIYFLMFIGIANGAKLRFASVNPKLERCLRL